MATSWKYSRSFLSLSPMRKFLCLIILTAMVAHSASRFGALSFLYEKRHAIAYSIGLIAEIPIAMCNSDYDFGNGLKFKDSQSQHAMPVCMQAHEINLFYVSNLSLTEPKKILLSQNQVLANSGNYCQISLNSVFRPPLV